MWSPLLLIATTPLLVGRSEGPLWPKDQLPLGGYTERHGVIEEGGGEDLKVRTLILKQGKTVVAIASCEMLTVPESLHDEVAARLPGVGLFLQATHTHCAPDSQMLNSRMTLAIPGIATFRPALLASTAERIATVIRRGMEHLEPVRTAEICQWRVAANRARRRLAQPDARATLLRLNGHPAIFNFAAHPTNYDETENRRHGDWPGEVSALFGCLCFAGALGDVSPAFPAASGPAEKIGNFCSLLSKPMSRQKGEKLEPTLGFVTRTFALPAATPHPHFAKDYGIPPALAQGVVRKFAPPQGRITVLRLGKSAWIGVAGEPTAELGRAMGLAGQQAGFSTAIPVSHVNGWTGYLLTPEDYARGGYEANLQLHGPQAGLITVQEARSALFSIGRQSR